MGEYTLPFSTSLLKYNTPEIVSTKSIKSVKSKTKKQELFGPNFSFPDGSKNIRRVNEETVEILNCILPPREWEKDGIRWKQKVSSEPVTRTDVIKLGEQLDLRLQESQAKMLGICPIRREIFTQCFDELVRQVTLNCVEQGILLLRVRDEMRMTCVAYRTLYESSIAFGLNKILQAQKEKEDKTDVMKKLKDEVNRLYEKITMLEERAKQEQRRNTEIRLAELKKNEEEMQFLKKTNQQLKLQLEGIINPKQ